MRYRGIVRGQVIILDEGIALQDGTVVEVTLLKEPLKGSPAALLEVWGSDVPEEAWDAVERAIEELDHADRVYEQKETHGSGISLRHGRM